MGIKWLSLASSLYFFLLVSSAAMAAEPASLEQPSTLLAARVSLQVYSLVPIRRHGSINRHTSFI